MRLKLQTPLFVADALLEAADQQLGAELETATEVRSDRGFTAGCCQGRCGFSAVASHSLNVWSVISAVVQL